MTNASIKPEDVEVLALTMMAGSPTDEAAMKAGAVMIAQAARIAELEGALRDLLSSVDAHNEANGKTMLDPHSTADARTALEGKK